MLHVRSNLYFAFPDARIMAKLMTLECGSRGTQRNRVIHAEQRSFDAIAAIRFFILYTCNLRTFQAY